jgi:hypothetical protein
MIGRSKNRATCSTEKSALLGPLCSWKSTSCIQRASRASSWQDQRLQNISILPYCGRHPRPSPARLLFVWIGNSLAGDLVLE